MNIHRFVEQLSDAELNRRRDAVVAVMQRLELDCIVCQGNNDWLGGYIRWLTGATAYYAYPRTILFFADGAMIVVDHGARGAEAMPPFEDPVYRGVEHVFYSPSYVSVSYSWTYDAEIVIRELRARDIRRLGILSGGGAYFGFLDAIQKWTGQAGIETVDVTNDIDRIKMIKSSEEQALIRRTAELQDQVMDELARYIRPGLKDFEVAAHARHMAQDLGAEQGVYLCSSAPEGVPATLRQKHAQGRQICAGDSFTILVETNGPGGFYTEIARTFVLGRASLNHRQGIQRAIDAQEFALTLLTPGAPCAEVIGTFNAYMREQGLPEEQRLFCHGQGHDLVERPLVREDEPFAIEENASIVVHPGFVVNGVFGHVCDNYLIGPGGPGECLHRTSKQVIEL